MPGYYINTMLGSSLCLVFILIDYLHKYKTDYFQRKLFVTLLLMTASTSLLDFLSRMAEGTGGGAATVYFFASVFFIVRNTTLYMLVVFLDYMFLKNTRRTKSASVVVSAVCALFAVSVLANLRFRFYFFVSDENAVVGAGLFPVAIAVTYLPLLLVCIDLAHAGKTIDSTHVNMLPFFLAIAAAGEAADDFIVKEGNLFLPCLTAALLYVYFFIIQNDVKTDALTGINNRYAFNEFINRVTKQTSEKSYALALIDIDRFKTINDTFGHAEGDRALCDLARIIKTSIRHTDFAARYGGDEFIIVTDSERTIRIILTRIENSIRAQNDSGGRRYRIEISYGIGVFVSNSGRDIDLFLDHIDRLMYTYKNSKRGYRTRDDN
jgi:diguanylate cyclase (GGDEF)-like protein